MAYCEVQNDEIYVLKKKIMQENKLYYYYKEIEYIPMIVIAIPATKNPTTTTNTQHTPTCPSGLGGETGTGRTGSNLSIL